MRELPLRDGLDAIVTLDEWRNGGTKIVGSSGDHSVGNQSVCKQAEVKESVLFAIVTCQHPIRLHDGNAELHGLLVLHAWLLADCLGSTGGGGRDGSERERGGADEMRGVNLDLFTPLGAHIVQRILEFLFASSCTSPISDVTIKNRPKAYTDPARILNGVCFGLHHIGRKGAGCGAQDELECICSIDLQAG